MKLFNAACIELGRCGRFCGMCELEDDEKRVIKVGSLFGVCRSEGRCIDKLCRAIVRQSMKKSEKDV